MSKPAPFPFPPLPLLRVVILFKMPDRDFFSHLVVFHPPRAPEPLPHFSAVGRMSRVFSMGQRMRDWDSGLEEVCLMSLPSQDWSNPAGDLVVEVCHLEMEILSKGGRENCWLSWLPLSLAARYAPLPPKRRLFMEGHLISSRGQQRGAEIDNDNIADPDQPDQFEEEAIRSLDDFTKKTSVGPRPRSAQCSVGRALRSVGRTGVEDGDCIFVECSITPCTTDGAG